jgi:chromosome segregation ATPase
MAKNGYLDCLLYACRNGAPCYSYNAKYIEDKLGITLETPQTITDTKPNTLVDTVIDNVHKATVHNNDELNNLVDMHLDQINQMETTLHNAKDNFLTLKKNYESLQKDLYSMKKAYGEKCEEINKVNDICEKMTLKLENISNLEIQLNANNEMIKSLQCELEKEKLKNEKIMLSIKSIIE